MTTTAPPAPIRSLTWPALLLGVALGGFFDGILLHQILQWHHLLSNVDAMRDLRTQILADGLFHALMYLLAAVALWLLWRRRAALAQAGAGRRLWALALVGFGAWHGADAVLSHWVLGIHRIKDDAANPLAWDLAWLAVFGVLPALAGWWALRRGGNDDAGHGGGGRHTAAALALAALVAGPLAALPAGSGGGSGNVGDQVTVLFAPGVTAAQAFNALARIDARVVWVDRSGGLWAVSLPAQRSALSLYRDGALLVGRSPVALGCLSWLRAPVTGSATAPA